MKKKPLLALCLAIVALSACADDDQASGHMDLGDDGKYTCEASLVPNVVEYSVDDDVLTLSHDAQNTTLKLTREGDGTGLLDSWLGHDEVSYDWRTRAVFIFEDDRMTLRYECSAEYGEHATSVEVSSRVLYTDSTIEILDDGHVKKSF